MAYDFRAWLKTKPDDEKYNFSDCTGNCAMGQYMAARGMVWDISHYNALVASELGNANALAYSETFGELKAKVLESV